MFGEQTLSNRPSAPAHGFGSSTRAHTAKVYAGGLAAKVPTGRDTPGPRYNLPHPAGMRYSFGTAQRFGVPDRFSDTPRTAASPGPAAYGNTSSIGKQTYSTNKSYPLCARKCIHGMAAATGLLANEAGPALLAELSCINQLP